MRFDIPHMIATGLIVFVVLWVVDHTAAFADATTGRKTLVKFIGIFLLLLILNSVWPYGTGV